MKFNITLSSALILHIFTINNSFANLEHADTCQQQTEWRKQDLGTADNTPFIHTSNYPAYWVSKGLEDQEYCLSYSDNGEGDIGYFPISPSLVNSQRRLMWLRYEIPSIFCSFRSENNNCYKLKIAKEHDRHLALFRTQQEFDKLVQSQFVQLAEEFCELENTHSQPPQAPFSCTDNTAVANNNPAQNIVRKATLNTDTRVKVPRITGYPLSVVADLVAQHGFKLKLPASIQIVEKTPKCRGYCAKITYQQLTVHEDDKCTLSYSYPTYGRTTQQIFATLNERYAAAFIYYSQYPAAESLAEPGTSISFSYATPAVDGCFDLPNHNKPV